MRASRRIRCRRPRPARRHFDLGLEMIGPVVASADAGEQTMGPIVVLGHLGPLCAERSDGCGEVGASERRRRTLAESRLRVQGNDKQEREQGPHRRLHSLLNVRSAGESAHVRAIEKGVRPLFASYRGTAVRPPESPPPPPLLGDDDEPPPEELPPDELLLPEDDEPELMGIALEAFPPPST